MAIRAQLSQERSRLRRDDLLAAAIELFAEGGSRAVTHRAVARRAGLPPATTTYYFESIDQLLHQALAQHLRSWRAELDMLAGFADTTDGPPASVEDLAGTIALVFAARGPEVAALELSIYLTAVRDETLREQARTTVREFETLVTRWLEVVGVPAPDRLAAAFMTVAAGTALRRQCGLYDEAEEADRMAETMRNLVAAHVLGGETVGATLTDLLARH